MLFASALEAPRKHLTSRTASCPRRVICSDAFDGFPSTALDAQKPFQSGLQA